MDSLGTYLIQDRLFSYQCQRVGDFLYRTLLSVAIILIWRINDPKMIYAVAIVISMGWITDYYFSFEYFFLLAILT